MKRLTQRHDHGIKMAAGYDFGIDPDDYDLVQEILARLAAYEDTGLEPDMIEAVINGQVTLQRVLEKYTQAEEQGRLVVLPCKVGDTVYILGHRFAAQIDEIVIDVDNGVTFNWSEYDRGPEETELWDDGWFTLDDIGKTVFLTREGAERALEGGQSDAD